MKLEEQVRRRRRPATPSAASPLTSGQATGPGIPRPPPHHPHLHLLASPCTSASSLGDQMQRHTLSLVWTLTKRDIETTVRAAVDKVPPQTPPPARARPAPRAPPRAPRALHGAERTCALARAHRRRRRRRRRDGCRRVRRPPRPRFGSRPISRISPDLAAGARGGQAARGDHRLAAGREGRLPCLTTAPPPPARWLQGLRSLLRPPAHSSSSS